MLVIQEQFYLLKMGKKSIVFPKIISQVILQKKKELLKMVASFIKHKYLLRFLFLMVDPF
jgi:hypothetical protein